MNNAPILFAQLLMLQAPAIKNPMANQESAKLVQKKEQRLLQNNNKTRQKMHVKKHARQIRPYHQ